MSNVVKFPEKSKRCPCPCEPVVVSREKFDGLVWEVVELRNLKELSLFERIFCWPYNKKITQQTIDKQE